MLWDVLTIIVSNTFVVFTEVWFLIDTQNQCWAFNSRWKDSRHSTSSAVAKQTEPVGVGGQ
eukprot:7749232-Ditylum_brightwellii.AAC.1